MGFYINEKFEVEVTAMETAVVTAVFTEYILERGEDMDEEKRLAMLAFIHKLTGKMHDHPDNELPNGH